LYCIEKDKAIDELTLEELKAVSPVFEEDLYEAVSMKTCVEKRLTIGAPGPEAMRTVIEMERAYLAGEWEIGDGEKITIFEDEAEKHPTDALLEEQSDVPE